jgi:lactobin A/cerein 7B family class IIb bacteriocin
MNLVREQEMQQIRGGAVKWGIIAGIGAFASFMIGVLDGWTNPKKCNK